MIEFYFMESAVNCFRPLELTQRQCRHGVTGLEIKKTLKSPFCD